MASVTCTEDEALVQLRQSAQAPINRLSAEILTSILCLCRPAILQPYFVADTLRLCHVCRLWRTYMLDLSSTWGTLSFDFDHLRRKSDYKPQPAVEFWYSHAKERPLSLSIISKNAFRTIIDNVLDSIAPFTNRLHELNLNIQSIDQVPFLTRKVGTFPSLGVLSLVENGKDTWNDEEKPPITVFDGAPALRSAVIYFKTRRLKDPSYFPLPWHQLTYLEIAHEIPPKTFHEIFQQCINLKEGGFVIGTLFQGGMEHIPHPIITFECLSALTLWDEHSKINESFFHDYVFPNLHLFELYCSPIFGWINLPSMPAGVCPGALRKLQLSNVNFKNAGTFFDYLSQCLSLESLDLYLPRIPHCELFSALATSVPFLPTLKTFGLTIHFPRHEPAFYDEDISTLGDFFAAWSKHVSTKKSVKFSSMMDISRHSSLNCFHAEMQQRLAYRICDRLQTWLYDQETCPTGIHFAFGDMQAQQDLLSDED
ncbi:hypothetical protein H2248_008936 [Termitomyces sp. 'cryptogamus']|nr:hypothetical protein H2248_008936 [Termitomyces sp. 'cryptogamus']